MVKWCLLVLHFFPLALLAQTPFPALPPVFKDDVLPRVDLTLPADSLALLLVPGSEYHWHARFVFDNGTIKDTIENVGLKIRGNTSIDAQKKSFRISFNTYEAGRTWYGLEKLNLNGSHNDPTVARAKISWDLLRSMGVPGSRSNHVNLYINGAFFGLYTNVEHVDEVFVQTRFGNDGGNLYKCLWPADLNYKGSSPDLYKEAFGGRRAYQLVTNEVADNYTDLAHFIDVLNNTPLADLPCELEKVFNVDSYLKACAFDVLDGNWDGPIYNKNNFYLYRNQATDRFEYIPYDLDNTLGIDWLNVDWVGRNIYTWAPANEPRPLYKRLLAVPEYKDRFSFYIGQALQSSFHPDSISPYLDALKALLSPSAFTDPYRPLDYGFTFNDFVEAWDAALPWFQTPTGLKPYFEGRWASASQQLLPADISPIIRQSGHFFTAATAIQVEATAIDDHQVTGMQVCFRWNGQAASCLDLFDDGAHADGVAADGHFANTIDLTGQAGRLEYYVQATDDAGQQSRQPVCGWRMAYVGMGSAPLAINEFMASNANTYPDEAGEFEDWIEIFNPGDAPIALQNFYLTDDEDTPAKWKMPVIWLPAQGYQVFWADSDESQGNRHANFKLGAGGEAIYIFEKNGDGFSLVDSYAFGAQGTGQATGRLPDGSGDFQPVAPTPAATNQPPLSVQPVGAPGIRLAVSPNPAEGPVGIALEGTAETIAEVEWLDTRGMAVLHKNGSGLPFMKVEAGTLPPGIYFLRVKTSGGSTAWCRVALQ